MESVMYDPAIASPGRKGGPGTRGSYGEHERSVGTRRQTPRATTARPGRPPGPHAAEPVLTYAHPQPFVRGRALQAWSRERVA